MDSSPAGLAPGTRRVSAVGDRLFHGVTAASALIVLALIGGIAAALVIGAWPALVKFGPAFVTSMDWNPVTDEYGAAVAIYGTLVSSA